MARVPRACVCCSSARRVGGAGGRTNGCELTRRASRPKQLARSASVAAAAAQPTRSTARDSVLRGGVKRTASAQSAWYLRACVVGALLARPGVALLCYVA